MHFIIQIFLIFFIDFFYIHFIYGGYVMIECGSVRNESDSLCLYRPDQSASTMLIQSVGHAPQVINPWPCWKNNKLA